MSFDIFVSAFNNEEEFFFPVKVLRDRFKGHIKSKQPGCWQLKFPEGACSAELYPGRSDMTSGFAVGRPPDFPSFWVIIAGILRDMPCVLYWPGNSSVIGRMETLPHLPKVIVERLGIPFVSTDPSKISQHVWDHS